MSRWAALITAAVVLVLSAATFVVRVAGDDVLARAAGALKDQPSYRTEFSVETKSTASFSMVMSGAVDQRTKLGRFTMRFTAPTGGRQITCTLVTSADAVYIPVPPAHRAQFGGKHWVSSGLSGLLPVQGLTPKGFDPASFAAIHDLSKTGSGTVRGVVTTTYHGALHIDKGQFKNVPPAAMQGIPDEIPVDLWVSDDGLIRKMQNTFTTHAGTIAITTTTRFEYFDFGVPVNITAPPANDVSRVAAANAMSACLS